jgi:plastocyanin domain-containing protein
MGLVLLMWVGMGWAHAEGVKGSPPRHVKLKITSAGFEPKEILAKPGEILVLEVTRTTPDEVGANAIIVPDLGLQEQLPLNREVPITIHASDRGRIAFGCPMRPFSGAVVIAP